MIREYQRLPGSIFRGMWQRFKKSRYDKSTDIPLVERNNGVVVTSENGNNQDVPSITAEPLAPATQIRQMPLRLRQSTKDEDNSLELDPLALDDENDPELKENDESIDRL